MQSISSLQVQQASVPTVDVPLPKPSGWQRQKFKRKRGKEGSKSWRRKRLHWRDVDREWQHFHRYWMKPIK
jgi:hypothetical protein